MSNAQAHQRLTRLLLLACEGCGVLKDYQGVCHECFHKYNATPGAHKVWTEWEKKQLWASLDKDIPF